MDTMVSIMKDHTIRVGVYLSADEYRHVQSILALRGVAFSEWVRECMLNVIATHDWRPKAKRGKQA